jgi:hypothetical protein
MLQQQVRQSLQGIAVRIYDGLHDMRYAWVLVCGSAAHERAAWHPDSYTYMPLLVLGLCPHVIFL